MCTCLLQLVFFFGKIHRSGIAGLYGSSIFNFFKEIMVFHSSCTSLYNGSFFSTSLPGLVICGLFGSSHSDRCEVIYHCGFHLHFPDD